LRGGEKGREQQEHEGEKRGKWQLCEQRQGWEVAVRGEKGGSGSSKKGEKRGKEQRHEGRKRQEHRREGRKGL